MNRLVIRADADQRIGAGHLMRCLALAQAWLAADRSATFLTCCASDSLRQRIASAGVQANALEHHHPHPSDLETTLRMLNQLAGNDRTGLNVNWLVLDGYHFDPGYQLAIRQAGWYTLVIDDFAHHSSYHADLLLNQNINAEQLHYSAGLCPRLLLGTVYVLLRREFLAWRDWQREIPPVARTILVTLGGADPDNVTFAVIRALREIDVPDIRVKVVAGPANKHVEMLQEAVCASDRELELLTAVSDMSGLMAWADLGISSGGSTCWEMAYMGLPNYIVALTENELQFANALSERGVAVHSRRDTRQPTNSLSTAVRSLLHDSDLRRELSRRGRMLVDGYGPTRVVDLLLEPFNHSPHPPASSAIVQL